MGVGSQGLLDKPDRVPALKGLTVGSTIFVEPAFFSFHLQAGIEFRSYWPLALLPFSSFPKSRLSLYQSLSHAELSGLPFTLTELWSSCYFP